MLGVLGYCRVAVAPVVLEQFLMWHKDGRQIVPRKHMEGPCVNSPARSGSRIC